MVEIDQLSFVDRWWASEDSGGGWLASRWTPWAKRRLWLDLDEAIRSQSVGCAYQPIVVVGDGRLVGVEALLRWHHDDLGVVPPEVVLELIARRQRGVEFDMFMIELVARQLPSVLARIDIDEPILTVNVEPRSFDVPGFADMVLDRLAATGSSPDGLVIEITERGCINDWSTARANSEALQHAGVFIAIDDFGVGSSNLQYLNELDIDFIKLDRSFVSVPMDPRQCALVGSVVDIARVHGARLIVEGVESIETTRLLETLGVEFVQGFAHGRPAALDAVLQAVGSAGGDSSGRSVA